MAWSSATVSIGAATKKADYDRLLANDVYLKEGATVFSGEKTFSEKVTFQSSTVFEVEPKVDGIKTRSSTGSVAVETAYIGPSSTTTVINIKRKVIALGSWNMDADSYKQYTHGITPANIINVQVFIHDDALGSDGMLPITGSKALANDATVYQDFQGGFRVGASYGVSGDGTKITVWRLGGGMFDSTAYNDTAMNRGFIIIDYIG